VARWSRRGAFCRGSASDIRTLGFLLFSDFAGSAIGTIFFTLALKHGNPPVVNVVLNIQPVISTAPFSSSAIALRLEMEMED
jgi:uncharacterized membrane protein